MIDPQLADEAKTYAARYAPLTDELLVPTRAVWAGRLRTWFATCLNQPAAAFRTDRLEYAMDDLVTLQMSREAVSADPKGLRITDLGGSVGARCARASLLLLVADRDPRLARQLSARAEARLIEARRTLRQLIASRH